MASSKVEGGEVELVIVEKIKKLLMDKKHESAKDVLVLELEIRNDSFDKTLEQYVGVRKELEEEAKDRHDLTDSKILDLLK